MGQGRALAANQFAGFDSAARGEAHRDPQLARPQARHRVRRTCSKFLQGFSSGSGENSARGAPVIAMKQHLRLIELLLSAQLLLVLLLRKKVGVGAVIAVIADLAIT